ncbi:MAG: HD-GYP domain-containing protein [Chthonomonadales bacterium]
MEQPPSISVLVVDEHAKECEVRTGALRREGYSVESALFEEGPRKAGTGAYTVVLCDGITGMGARTIRLITREAPHVPVIAVVRAGNAPEAHRARAMGATEIVTQPFGIHDLPLAIERAMRAAGIWNRTCHRIRVAAEADETALDALLSAMRTKAADPHEDPERIATYAMELASRMHLPEELQKDVARGALLHDVGKLAIPDAILLKPAPLSNAEWVEVQAHPIIGYRMCAAIPALRPAAEIVLHHHERWDGCGYPDGLAGQEIPLGARIVAIAAAFDAITAGRSYRQAATVDEARKEIARCAATQFDPDLADAFLAVPEARWQTLLDLFIPLRTQ